MAYRGWLIAPVVGSGTDDDPIRADVPGARQEGDRLEFVIGGEPTCLVAADVARKPAGLRMPSVDEVQNFGRVLDPNFEERLHLGNGRAPGPGSFTNDSFTDTAGVNLTAHTGETGAAWTEHTTYTAGDAVISDANRLRSNAASSLVAYSSGNPATAAYDVETRLFVVTVAGTNVGSAARINTAADTMYWFLYVAGSTRWELFKRLTGVSTSLGTFTQTLSTSTSYRLTAGVRDQAKVLYVDGIERISSTDNAITAAGKAGIRCQAAVANNTGIHWDSFTASDPLSLPVPQRAQRRHLLNR